MEPEKERRQLMKRKSTNQNKASGKFKTIDFCLMLSVCLVETDSYRHPLEKDPRLSANFLYFFPTLSCFTLSKKTTYLEYNGSDDRGPPYQELPMATLLPFFQVMMDAYLPV